MTPKEKATQLVNDFKPLCPAWEFSNTPEEDEIESGKSCAIIAVDEIIDYLNELNYQELGKITGLYNQGYWEGVKEEINKL